MVLDDKTEFPGGSGVEHRRNLMDGINAFQKHLRYQVRQYREPDHEDTDIRTVGLLYVLPHQNQLRHQLSLAETMAWSAILILPVLLILTSLGYFGARWIQQKRAKSQATN